MQLNSNRVSIFENCCRFFKMSRRKVLYVLRSQPETAIVANLHDSSAPQINILRLIASTGAQTQALVLVLQV